MAQLLVRGLSDDLVRRLREQAKEHGRSVEAEHRAILEAAVRAPANAADLAAALQKMTWLAELDPAELRGNDPPREFGYDQLEGTKVKHARPAAGHDGAD